MCRALIREQLKGAFIFHTCYFYIQGMGTATSEQNHESLCNTFIKKKKSSKEKKKKTILLHLVLKNKGGV